MNAPNNNEQTVYVVDDDAGMRKSLRMKFELAGFHVRECPSAEAFLSDFDRQKTGCVVLDLRMEQMSGLELFEQLVRTQATIPVVFLTGHGDVPLAVRAMRLGAFDFMEKPCDPNRLVRRVRQAIGSDLAAAERRAELDRIRKSIEKLTAAERVVLSYVMKGFTAAEIAAELHRSPRTIENHRNHLLAKMQAKNLSEVVRLAVLVELADSKN